MLVSKECGYATSYRPGSGEKQVTFEKGEVDGWTGYCSTPMNTEAICTTNKPAYATKWDPACA